MRTHPTWPVIREYRGENLNHVAMPLGGIGTGTISLGGRGNLRDFEVMNRPAKGYVPQRHMPVQPSFVLRVKSGDQDPVLRLIEGPMSFADQEGVAGAKASNHGWPRFEKCRFAAAYPLAQVMLSDPRVPVSIRLEAFNPLVPVDTDASGIPAVVIRFVLTNRITKALTASVCATLPNFIGNDGEEAHAKGNCNTYRVGHAVRGLFMNSDGINPARAQWGTLALSTTARRDVSYRTNWAEPRWGSDLLDFWDDLATDGALDDRQDTSDHLPTASLCVKTQLAPRATRQITFIIAWHFPNRLTWNPEPAAAFDVEAGAVKSKDPDDLTKRVGNYYATRYNDAWDVAEYLASALPTLERKTVGFVNAFARSDLPLAVKEAALFNLANLRTQTAFRTENGDFFGWEGCGDHRGLCYGSCTHVWNYEHATAFLFGSIARNMRRIEFAHATDDQGLMSFRVALPLTGAKDYAKAAADGQMGCLIKLYRDWRLSGDERLLRDTWPHAKRALEFCWVRDGWDADRDGVMEGVQHNTMDVEYFGPNPHMTVLYLGALRACQAMATHLGDSDFAATCHDLQQRGRAWVEVNLFNGSYYEQQVRALAPNAQVPPGLTVGLGSEAFDRPEWQIGPGCEVNQLFGQFMADLAGLPDLLDPTQMKIALRSLFQHNFAKDLSEHFNILRTYASGRESGLLMCTYPRGTRPARPFSYATEVWTGMEYMVAGLLSRAGMQRQALTLVQAVRDRHDGRRRNPFNEVECGHHYARAMSSWALVPLFTGYGYDAITGQLRFSATRNKVTWFWSNGDSWGTITQSPNQSHTRVHLRVLHGTLRVKQLELTGRGRNTLQNPLTLGAGQSLRISIRKSAKKEPLGRPEK